MLQFPDEMLISENCRNDNALRYNNKIKKNVNIVKNQILNNDCDRHDMHDWHNRHDRHDRHNRHDRYDRHNRHDRYDQYDRYNRYTNQDLYNQYDSNYLYDSRLNTNLPISLNFAKKTIISVKDLFDMHLLDNNMRLFVTKDLHPWQVIHIIQKLDIMNPKDIGYEIYADCILPIYLDYQDNNIFFSSSYIFI